ncbi:MAG: hypothetical protein LC795_11315 [Acidobacteria bacterium]|nr:hypothetical protein [Acidobacteriota bacterium]MCA1619880.1 hypothetical protein [Acidobacteriota bacterium]
MPTWVKILLAIGGVLLVLLMAAAVVGYVVVRKYGPGMIESTRHSFEEGTEYGRQTDQEGCLNEAAARQARVGGMMDMIRNGVFVETCLSASRPTPGFCDGVPRQLELMKAVSWQQQQCRRFGLKPEQQCGQLFQGVQRFCEGRARLGNMNEAPKVRVGDDAPPPPPAPASAHTPGGR